MASIAIQVWIYIKYKYTEIFWNLGQFVSLELEMLHACKNCTTIFITLKQPMSEMVGKWFFFVNSEFERINSKNLKSTGRSSNFSPFSDVGCYIETNNFYLHVKFKVQKIKGMKMRPNWICCTRFQNICFLFLFFYLSLLIENIK